MFRIPRTFTTLSLAAMLGVAAPAVGAGIDVTADTPVSFRATFTGLDTDAKSVDGNDFQQWTFDYWTVLVNLRIDGIDVEGEAFGFYEVQLTRTGNVVANLDAPIVKSFLFYGDLKAGVVLTDNSVSSATNGIGSDMLSTTVNIEFDLDGNAGSFSGSIAGDADLDGDGTPDTTNTDVVVTTLKGLKDAGIITGKEIGQIIKQTRQPRK